MFFALQEGIYHWVEPTEQNQPLTHRERNAAVEESCTCFYFIFFLILIPGNNDFQSTLIK